MQRSKFDYLGWVLAAGLAGIMASSGFQATTDKSGVVDIAKVVEQSTYGKANQTSFQAMKEARESLLEFIDQNRVLTNEQAQRLKDIAVKENPTDAEKAEAERIKAEVVASAKRSQELSGKATLTPEERTLMDEYSRRSQTMQNVAARWYQEFTGDMQEWADKRKMDSVQKAREAIQSVAKAQGYTIIFEVGIAPYGANDLTDAALQAMNAQK